MGKPWKTVFLDGYFVGFVGWFSLARLPVDYMIPKGVPDNFPINQSHLNPHYVPIKYPMMSPVYTPFLVWQVFVWPSGNQIWFAGGKTEISFKTFACQYPSTSGLPISQLAMLHSDPFLQCEAPQLCLLVYKPQ
jgi:hypothetical protein